MRLTGLLAIALGLLLAARAVAEPRQGEFVVHDLSVWMVDSAAPMANARDSHPSALPASVSTSRTARSSLSQRRDGPLGLLTFYGQPASELDVELRIKGGSFLAHWPSGESMPNRLRWSGSPGTQLVEQPGSPSAVMLVDDEHWFNVARRGDALFVRRGARAERFLAYDAELDLKTAVQVQGGPDTYTIANDSDGTLYDVLVAVRTPEGVRVAWIDKLPKTPGVSKVNPALSEKAVGLFGVRAKPADKAAADVKRAKDRKLERLFSAPAKPLDKAPAAAPAEAPAADAPAPAEPPKGVKRDKDNKAKGLFGSGVQPRAAASDDENNADKPGASGEAKDDRPVARGMEFALSDPLPVDSAEAVAATREALAERLMSRGLSKGETDVVLAQYGPMLFESDELVILCRLDASEIDERLQISVFPVPNKIVRVLLVLIRNVDPKIHGEIETLVAQLGDLDYEVREAAEKRLTELGPLAFDALNKAIKHEDMEVVIRAERILVQQKQKAEGRQGATGTTETADAAPAARPAAPVPAQAPVLVRGLLRLLGN